VRWNHPEKGLLFPDKFIELAEQQRLMLPLGTWVLREAIQCARRWSALGWDMRVAVNLSMLQFQSDDFVPTVIRLLEEERVPARLLELELTERMLLDEISGVRHKIKQLKAMGIRIAMDDFGTGYSSLSQLKDLPIDKMKIDRSFVQDLPENQDAAAIARAIVQMSRSMGLPVIAEGVETVAQRQFLTQLGVSDLQGLLISPPLSTADFDVWMRGRKGM
jgi:EAL domain-containing protein (putative c-di-GMP-specific phosphodiesterase class I)